MHSLWLLLPHILIFPHQILGLKRTNKISSEKYDGYYNYAGMTDRLQRFAHKYAHICRLSSIGRSVEGKELWVMRITTSPTADLPGKPRMKYVGNIHGDEALSRQVLMYLIEHLLTRFGRDVRVTELVTRTDIYILVSMNPDGFERAVEGDCPGTAGGRENAGGYDLDKSFPDQDEPDEKTANDIPEVAAVMKWMLEKKFVLSGSLHGGSMMASDDGSSYTSPVLAADDALFRNLAQSFTENHPITKTDDPGCSDDPNKAEGEESGGMQEYNYLRGNCFEVTLELSCCKYPASSQLNAEWTNNQEALLAFIQKVHIGVRGFVMTRSGFGIPDAAISVSGIDHNITTWKFGDYYRLLLPGRYDITASSPGYLANTVKNVPVTEGKATLLNFTLDEPIEESLILDPSDQPILTDEGLQTADPPKTPVSNLNFQHLTYEQMEMFLQLFSGVYPSITYLGSAGRSAQERNLYVMEISTNPGVDQQGKPEVMFVGNLHGNELIGREILLNLIEYLCRNYNKDPLVTRLVNSTRIHIMPSMNPDGYELALQAQSEPVSGDLSIIGHGNSHRVDLNTNFPKESRSRNVVEAETQAVMNWIKSHSFVLSASIRGGFRGIVYPSFLDSIDEEMFKSVAEVYYTKSLAFQEHQACDVPRTRQKKGTKGTKHHRPVVKGTDLLTWAYHSTDSFAVHIGLSCELFPADDSLYKYWEQNHGALLHFIQQVHLFVRGMVTDAHSGKGIANASVEVEGSKHKVHTSSTGQYWRPLAPGSYHITASAPGYTPVSASVRVLETRVEQVDFKLSRDAPQPSVEVGEQTDFEKLVEQLLAPGELDQLVRGLLPAQTLQYRLYRDRSEFLRGLTINFPHITRLYSLGQSSEFRTIWALEIAGNLKTLQPAEPKILFVAGVHGNAAVGPEILLEFSSVLCLNYGRNPAITKLIDRSRILIVPCVNPDGRELALEGLCLPTVGYTNANGKDLDKDFFYGNASVQPETRAVMNLIHGGGFSLSVVLDGGSLLATYPYNRPDYHAQNEATLRYLASLYSNTHPIMHLGNLGCTDKSEKIPGGILKGADFRAHTGSMKDFSLDVGVCPEITVYTGCCMFPSATQLFSQWMENRTPLFRMLLEVHRRLSGVVRDRTGRPLSDAVVVVNGSVSVRADAQGHFTALVAPGTHQLQVQAHGYQQELQQVNTSPDRVTSPILIDFTADEASVSQAVLLIATGSLVSVLICVLLVWHLRSAKFSRIREGVRWLRRKRDDLRMEAMVSEKSPLRQEFLDESESEDDPFYDEGR